MAVGPSICAAFRYWIHAGGIGGEAPRPLARGIERFRGWMQRHNIDPDRDYVRFYEHYLLKLPQECLERIRALASVGVTDFGLILNGNAHELMRRFSRAVIAPW